ncbi:MAG: hypothetical protein KF842_06340 [Caulobacter sp.]|nr:hypothetical protein [Caulobacter sp.]
MDRAKALTTPVAPILLCLGLLIGCGRADGRDSPSTDNPAPQRGATYPIETPSGDGRRYSMQLPEKAVARPAGPVVMFWPPSPKGPPEDYAVLDEAAEKAFSSRHDYDSIKRDLSRFLGSRRGDYFFKGLISKQAAAGLQVSSPTIGISGGGRVAWGHRGHEGSSRTAVVYSSKGRLSAVYLFYRGDCAEGNEIEKGKYSICDRLAVFTRRKDKLNNLEILKNFTEFLLMKADDIGPIMLFQDDYTVTYVD